MRTKREQKATAFKAKVLFYDTFFWIQLQWYGNGFGKRNPTSTLKKKLLDAGFSGNCDSPPASVTQLEQDMRRDLGPNLKIWDEKVNAWNTARQAEHDEAWAKCETPAEQAEEDLARFMEHYFLTDGVPDPTKNPKILEFQGYKKGSKFHEAAKRAPGLEIVSHADTDREIVYMGWDCLAVWRHARDCSREYRHRIARWRGNAPMSHQNPVASRVAFKQGRGSYAVRCKEINVQWPRFSPLTLGITRGPSTFIAAGEARSGYFQGTMLFAVDDTLLAKHLDEDIEDVAAANEEPEANPDEGSGRKRKHAPSAAESGQNKKMKAPVHRVFFRMRTSKTGAEPTKGYLDFSGEHLTTFTGEMEVPYVNGRVKLEGFKYTNSARRYVDSWGFHEEDAQLRQNLAFAESMDGH